jgi:hypothetical protein
MPILRDSLQASYARSKITYDRLRSIAKRKIGTATPGISIDHFAVADTVVFIHIPKTAGTSITQYLRSELDAKAPRKRLLSGHHYLHELYPKVPNGFFISIVRDPLQRTLSQFKSLHDPSKYDPNWRSEWSRTQVAALEFCQTATFREFINSNNNLVLNHVFNPQARMLSDVSVDAVELIEDLGAQERVLESACQNLLAKLHFVGIFERLPESIAYIGQRIGRNSMLPYLNKSAPINIDVSCADKSKLSSMLRLDIELYRTALRIFESRLSYGKE